MSLISSIISSLDWTIIIQILITGYIVKFYYKYFTRQSPLPGPFPLPLTGNVHQFKTNPAKYAMDNRDKFGDMFELWVGSNRFIILGHAKLLDQVYVSSINSKFFARFSMKDFQLEGMQHGVVFNDNYKTWKRSRKIVIQSLMSPRFLRKFTHQAQELFNENEKHWDQKEFHIDFSKWIKCFTTDIMLQTVTGKPSYALNTFIFGEENIDPIKSKEIKRTVNFTEAFNTFTQTVMFQMFVPKILKDYVPGISHLNRKFKKNTEWLKDTISEIVDERRAEIKKMTTDDKTGAHLIDVLLTLNTPRDPNYTEGEAPLTEDEIRTTIIEVTAAGTDTTSNTFCFVVWLLARHPSVLTRFQEEIKEILGDDISRPITYEELENFTYLEAIIKESTRIIPLVPLSPRTSTQESTIDGKHFDSGTVFFVNHDQVHQQSDCWKDPEQFIPERFLKESDDEIVKNSYVPFGGGIRICPGRHMAMVELKTLLIMLFRKYDIELVDKVAKRPKTQYTGANNCTDLKSILHPRKVNINV